MSNLFIKFPTDNGEEKILNLRNLTQIHKCESSFGKKQYYCIYFHDSSEEPFIYSTENKKIRDDFFEAILQKLSLNN